jgi:hypothetical protein
LTLWARASAEDSSTCHSANLSRSHVGHVCTPTPSLGRMSFTRTTFVHLLLLIQVAHFGTPFDHLGIRQSRNLEEQPRRQTNSKNRLYRLFHARESITLILLHLQCSVSQICCCPYSYWRPFHGGNTGSNPVGDAKKSIACPNHPLIHPSGDPHHSTRALPALQSKRNLQACPACASAP